jgi:SAM-dependent methyltransferase
VTDAVIEHFDGVADSYDEVLPFFAAFAGLTVERLKLVSGVRALDLACGRGALAIALADRGADVTAVDGAPRMIALLRAARPDISALVMNAAELDLPSAAFDLTVCGFALHIVTDPDAVLSEAVRVTAPGGRVAFTVPGPSPEHDDPLIDLYAEYRTSGNARHGNDFDYEFERFGLSDVRAETLEIAIPVPDGETYWNWSRSHGSGRFIDGLTPYRRAEMHARLLEEMVERPDFVLRRSAVLWSARVG